MLKWLWLFSAVWLAAAQAGTIPPSGFVVDENSKYGTSHLLKFFRGNETITVGELGQHTSLDAKGVTSKWKAISHNGRRIEGVTVELEGSVDLEMEACFDFGPSSVDPKNVLLLQGDPDAAVSERFWLTSSGTYYYFYPETPLFTRSVKGTAPTQLMICFMANVTVPYSTKRTRNVLKYDIWYHDDPKDAHAHVMTTFLGKPSGVPDQRMIQYPVWSTLARYSRDIDKDKLWAYANEIKDNGFQNAQLQIDDRWENCYGSLTVDNAKFPNFKELIQDIKGLGFRVSLWVHPFINKDCDPWYSEALEKGYLVLNEEGSPDTSWWNSDSSGAGYIDFTNPEAAEWFANRVQNLIDTYDIDTFDFGAGESSWSPQIPVQRGDIELHPYHIVSSYVRTVARFGSAVTVRSGMRTQELPIFTRMATKFSSWYDDSYGLSTLIPSLLQMNLNGYPLVSPGVIGGNGASPTEVNMGPPSKELFIRWLQASVFMPTLQFSFVPWDYDAETVEIFRRYTQLHADFANNIVEAMELSVMDGRPVNAPLWWADATDPETYTITDEYLLGTDILVAPVLTLYATYRDIYLPKGTWYESGDPTKPHVGPTWLRKFPAPLDVLPYFVKGDPMEDPTGAATAPTISGVLIVFLTAIVTRVW